MYTVVDFWRMIHDYKCTSLVYVHPDEAPKQVSQTCLKYARRQKVNYDCMTVSVIIRHLIVQVATFGRTMLGLYMGP